MELGANIHVLPSPIDLPDELISRLPRRIDHPLASPTIEFLVTSRCNLRCRYCYSYSKDIQEDLSMDVAVSFLDAYMNYQREHFINHSLRRFVFSGGEPTLNPDTIFNIMEYIDEHGIKCIPMILTNGIINSDILKRLIDIKFYFQISFDGNDNQFRTTSRGINVNDQIVKTIKRVAEAGLPIDIRVVITKENVSHMVDVVKFAAENEVESVLFAPVSKLANAKEYNIERPPINEYLNNYHQALNLAKSLNIHIPMVEKSRYKYKGEYVELPKLVIFPDGSLTMMTVYTSARAQGVENDIIGKYTMKDGLLVNYEKIKKLVRNFLRNINLHCKTCECFIYCRGRTIDNCYLFISNEILSSPEWYFCEFSNGIYDELQKQQEEKS